MKTAEEILASYENFHMTNEEILQAMETYADQWKYDFSKECKCTYSPGETWCCNLCGLPTSKHTEK